MHTAWCLRSLIFVCTLSLTAVVAAESLRLDIRGAQLGYHDRTGKPILKITLMDGSNEALERLTSGNVGRKMEWSSPAKQRDQVACDQSESDFGLLRPSDLIFGCIGNSEKLPDITHGIENMLYTEILPDDTDQPGITKQQFETAVSVWTWMQPENEAPTVAATAASFNTTPEIVRECVRGSEWMFLDGPDDDPTKQRVETREAGEQEPPAPAPSGRW